jgi:hypothetical protein
MHAKESYSFYRPLLITAVCESGVGTGGAYYGLWLRLMLALKIRQSCERDVFGCRKRRIHAYKREEKHPR